MSGAAQRGNIPLRQGTKEGILQPTNNSSTGRMYTCNAYTEDIPFNCFGVVTSPSLLFPVSNFSLIEQIYTKWRALLHREVNGVKPSDLGNQRKDSPIKSKWEMINKKPNCFVSQTRSLTSFPFLFVAATDFALTAEDRLVTCSCWERSGLQPSGFTDGASKLEKESTCVLHQYPILVRLVNCDLWLLQTATADIFAWPKSTSVMREPTCCRQLKKKTGIEDIKQ